RLLDPGLRVPGRSGASALPAGGGELRRPRHHRDVGRRELGAPMSVVPVPASPPDRSSGFPAASRGVAYVELLASVSILLRIDVVVESDRLPPSRRIELRLLRRL